MKLTGREKFDLWLKFFTLLYADYLREDIMTESALEGIAQDADMATNKAAYAFEAFTEAEEEEDKEPPHDPPQFGLTPYE